MADMVMLLLEAGADANFMSQSGKSPLIMAATAGNLDAVQLLLSRTFQVLLLTLVRGCWRYFVSRTFPACLISLLLSSF